jgi:hypothetical protein
MFLGIVWNPSCMISQETNVLYPSPHRLDDLLNRTDKSRVISCHSRDIGVACLRFCNHYKDNGQGHVLYHDLEVCPVCFDKSFKVEMCGSGG